MNEPLRIPQLTDEEREALEALQARINETIRGIGAAFEAIAQALTNAAKGFTAFQDAFTLAPPPAEEPTPHRHLPGQRMSSNCAECNPKEPTP
ncbi:hypothetical protein HRW18_05545 [Streptomyces lunaelactis]|uniref:hypothetical protein n=1 Tax=Streptomyces lunaelactis TaxID=1535768 RepID=UPI001584B34D|nr:hypothetical protein [Streptomyces lunaelactis]NUK07487.1 hypothetical protein [Streptomyces lunaelactis]